MENNVNTKLNELKSTMKLHNVVKLKSPIEIKVRLFNFNTGCADTVIDMRVEYVAKVPYGSESDESYLAGHVMMVYGKKKYGSGNCYDGSVKLTYTDDEELQKVIDAVRESGSPRPMTENVDSLRRYVN